MFLCLAGCNHNAKDPTDDGTNESRVLDFRLVKTSRSARAAEETEVINKAETPYEINSLGSLTEEQVNHLFVFETDPNGVKVTFTPVQEMIDNNLNTIFVRWIDNNGYWNISQSLDSSILEQFNNGEITSYTWIYPITNADITYNLVGFVGYNNPLARDGYSTAYKDGEDYSQLYYNYKTDTFETTWPSE